MQQSVNCPFGQCQILLCGDQDVCEQLGESHYVKVKQLRVKPLDPWHEAMLS